MDPSKATVGGDDSSVVGGSFQRRADAGAGDLGFNEVGIGRSTRKSFFSKRLAIKILIGLVVVVLVLFAVGILP